MTVGTGEQDLEELMVKLCDSLASLSVQTSG